MANLIVNGDAETGDLTGWDINGPYPLPVVVSYGTVDAQGLAFPTAEETEDPDPGAYFYAGGADVPLASMSQTIDLGPWRDAIAAGEARWELSAHAGGWGDHDDYVGVSIEFVEGDAPAAPQYYATLLPVQFSGEREGRTGLKAVSKSGEVPTWSTVVIVGVQCVRVGGRFNDGYVDGISLTIS